MSSRFGALVVVICLVGCTAPAQTTARPAVTLASSVPEEQSATARWIEVVLEDQSIYLWEDNEILETLPMSSGVNESPATTTYSGEFIVETMYPGPEETAPGVYVRDIIIFDWEHGNGFHSLPMDVDGQILDPTLGKPASAGCIRVANSALLYEFAKVGMKVVIR